MKLGDKEKNLIRLSKALGMSDAEIAEKVGCAKSTIWYYLNKNPLTITEQKETVKDTVTLQKKIKKQVSCVGQYNAGGDKLEKEPTKIDAELERNKLIEEGVIKEAPSMDKIADELLVETQEHTFEPDNLQEVYAEAIKQQEVEILSLQNKVIELKAQCNEQEKMLKVMAVVNNLSNDILKIFRGEE